MVTDDRFLDSDGNFKMNGSRLRAYRNATKRWPDGRMVARPEKGATQQELAEEAQISRSYLAEIEQGEKRPRMLVAESLARALGVDKESLATR